MRNGIGNFNDLICSNERGEHNGTITYVRGKK